MLKRHTYENKINMKAVDSGQRSTAFFNAKSCKGAANQPKFALPPLARVRATSAPSSS